MIRVNFTKENYTTIRDQYESQGYVPVMDSTSVDGSGFFDFELIVPGSINKRDMLADGIDTIIISDLINPTTVIVEGSTYIVTDSVFEFSVDTPGTYFIHCEIVNYETRSFIVNAS